MNKGEIQVGDENHAKPSSMGPAPAHAERPAEAERAERAEGYPSRPPERPVALVGDPFAMGGVIRALAAQGAALRVLCPDEHTQKEALRAGCAGVAASAASASRPATPGSLEPAPAAVLGAEVEIVRGTLDESERLAALLQGARGVVFLSPVGLNGRTWRPQTHLPDLQHLIAAADARELRKFVYLSTLGASGKSKVRCLREAAGAEKLVAASRMEDFIFRAGPLLGRGDGFLSKISEQAGQGPPLMSVPGYGDTLLQPIHVDDLGRCIARGFSPEPEALRPGRYSVAGTETVSLLELMDEALRKRERFKFKLHIPLFAMRLAALFSRSPREKPSPAPGKLRLDERVGLLCTAFVTEHNDAPRLLRPRYRLKSLAETQLELLATPAGVALGGETR